MLLTWLQQTPGWVLPGASLDMNFAAGTYYPAGGVGGLITTTRAQTVSSYATTSTGSLTAFAANTPRITDLGLLVEQSSTNTVIQSGFVSGWTTQNSTVTTGQSAPDGTTTAIKLTDSVGSAQHRQFQGSITVTNVPWTFSVYAKAGTIPYIQILFNDGTTSFWANFNISTGVVASKAASATNQTITALANGLYRCSFTATPAAGTGNIQILMLDTDVPSVAPAYTGTGTGTIFLWGPQLEALAFPTSYIPTTTVAVARAADVVSLTGAAATASLAAKAAYIQTFGVTISNGNRLVQYSGTNSAFFYNDATHVQAIAVGSTGSLATFGSGTVAGTVKVATGFDSSSVSMIANGGTKATDAVDFGVLSGPVYVGNRSDGARALNGYMARAVWGPVKGQFDGLTA